MKPVPFAHLIPALAAIACAAISPAPLGAGQDGKSRGGPAATAPATAESAWELKSPRDEIAVQGSLDPATGALELVSPNEEGSNGFWEKTYAVTGGKPFRFSALRRAEAVEHPRRSCEVRIAWQDEKGGQVTSPHPVNPAYRGKATTAAVPDFPRDREFRRDGWTLVADTYEVPEKAAKAVVQLHLRWAPGGRVVWKDVTFAESDPLPPRKVKLAAIHYNLPGGGRTAAGNREEFAPLIAQAAAQGAGLVVLPEVLTCKGVDQDTASLAEPVPGPSTKYFGELAKKHDCYLVVGLLERSGHLIYNVAVLLGPDGKVAGKYRKVTLPREEIAKGIAPGHEYPVFETRFGKVGMMVCYDVFFPEVARRLAMNGAEVIALPIWGGNPMLAAARCAENGVFLVSSTYTDHETNWMKTAVWDREGNPIVEAGNWGSVVVAEVDLSRPAYWEFLGDFQSRIAREGPVWEAE